MMGSAMQWMIRHDVERACGQVLVTPPALSLVLLPVSSPSVR